MTAITNIVKVSRLLLGVRAVLTNLEADVSIENYEKRNDRLSLAICSLGSFFLFLFAVKSFLSGSYAHASILFSFGALASCLTVYFLNTENRKIFQGFFYSNRHTDKKKWMI